MQRASLKKGKIKSDAHKVNLFFLPVFSHIPTDILKDILVPIVIVNPQSSSSSVEHLHYWAALLREFHQDSFATERA